MKHHILLIDDACSFRESTSSFLKKEGYEVTSVANGDEAIAIVRQGISQFSLALVDYHMPELSGNETIKELKKLNPDLVIYTLSGDDTNEAYERSLDSGAVFFIQKDISNAKLSGLLRRTCIELENKTKVAAVLNPTESQKLIEQVGMIGVSDQMVSVAKLILKFAPYNETVLIRGENGTGKEKVARAIHVKSRQAKGPFIAVNCAAISEALFESELFGHVKGAFTGANKDKIGIFEAANGGTLFLDEIGELAVHLQAKLLRVLQEKQIIPVGSTKAVSVDFRLVVATNAALEKKIKEGAFREDLYYRLNVLPIDIKPLRERAEDIRVLALNFLEQYNIENKQSKKFLNKSLEQLSELQWSGNVRELQQTVKFLSAISNEQYINIDPYIKKLKYENVNVFDQRTQEKETPDEEKSRMIKALTTCKTISEAARQVNMYRTTFRDKMKKYNLVNNEQLT